MLEGINQNRHRLYQRPKKKTKQDLGREGVRVRQTLQSLRAIQHLLKWKQSDQAATVVPESLKKGVLYQGIKVFLGEGKHGAKEVRAFIQSFKTDKISKERQQAISKIIGRLVFDLFDLDYHKYKASLILQSITSKAIRNRFEQLLNEMSTEAAIQVFWAEQTINLKSVEEESITDCIKIVLQHFDIVMRHAFSNLGSLPVVLRYIICTEFLNHLQCHMHWPEVAVQRMASSVIDSWLEEEENSVDVISFEVRK